MNFKSGNQQDNFQFCQTCNCNEYFVKVVNVQLIKSKNLNTFAQALGSIALFPLKIFVGLNRADTTHESLLFELKCTQCDMNFQLTIDRDEYEERMRFGEFMNKSFRFRRPQTIKFQNLLLSNLRQIFFIQESENYNIINNNCGHFARKILKQCEEVDARIQLN